MGIFCHWEKLVAHTLKKAEHSSELPRIPAGSLTSSLACGSLRWDSSCFNVLACMVFLLSSTQTVFPCSASSFSTCSSSTCSSTAFLKECHLYVNCALFSPSPAHLSNHTQLLVVWPKKDAPDHTSFSQCEGEYASPTYLS